MCTLIALLHPSEDARLLFLENRDRPVEAFQGNDFRLIANRVAGIYDYRSDGLVCGYHLQTLLYGGLTNVLGYVGAKSRGVLLKQVLTTAKTLDQALETLLAELKTGDYSPANYVLGDGDAVYRIENFAKAVHMDGSVKMQIATNHFRFLNRGVRLENSIRREQYVTAFLQGKKRVTAKTLVHLASRHRNGVAICRHGRTLASAIFTVPANANDVQILYQIGYPCHGYKEFIL